MAVVAGVVVLTTVVVVMVVDDDDAWPARVYVAPLPPFPLPGRRDTAARVVRGGGCCACVFGNAGKMDEGQDESVLMMRLVFESNRVLAYG